MTQGEMNLEGTGMDAV